MTYQELLDFYTKMSLSEFEEYILELHSQNIQFDDSVSRIEYDNINTNGLARGSSRVSQYYYYPTGSNNYIGLTTYNIIIGGTSYYQSVYRYEVSQAFSYPYFKPVGYSYTPSSDSRQLTCTFECNKHISATVIQTGIFRLTTTFTAQGGGTITTNNFSTAGAVNDSGVRLRNYPNTTSTILELMYFPEDVLIDMANSTMTFYRVKREATGTVGYVSKEYINRAQVACE